MANSCKQMLHLENKGTCNRFNTYHKHVHIKELLITFIFFSVFQSQPQTLVECNYINSNEFEGDLKMFATKVINITSLNKIRKVSDINWMQPESEINKISEKTTVIKDHSVLLVADKNLHNENIGLLINNSTNSENYTNLDAISSSEIQKDFSVDVVIKQQRKMPTNYKFLRKESGTHNFNILDAVTPPINTQILENENIRKDLTNTSLFLPLHTTESETEESTNNCKEDLCMVFDGTTSFVTEINEENEILGADENEENQVAMGGVQNTNTSLTKEQLKEIIIREELNHTLIYTDEEENKQILEDENIRKDLNNASLFSPLHTTESRIEESTNNCKEDLCMFIDGTTSLVTEMNEENKLLGVDENEENHVAMDEVQNTNTSLTEEQTKEIKIRKQLNQTLIYADEEENSQILEDENIRKDLSNASLISSLHTTESGTEESTNNCKEDLCMVFDATTPLVSEINEKNILLGIDENEENQVAIDSVENTNTILTEEQLKEIIIREELDQTPIYTHEEEYTNNTSDNKNLYKSYANGEISDINTSTDYYQLSDTIIFINGKNSTKNTDVVTEKALDEWQSIKTIINEDLDYVVTENVLKENQTFISYPSLKKTIGNESEKQLKMSNPNKNVNDLQFFFNNTSNEITKHDGKIVLIEDVTVKTPENNITKELIWTTISPTLSGDAEIISHSNNVREIQLANSLQFKDKANNEANSLQFKDKANNEVKASNQTNIMSKRNKSLKTETTFNNKEENMENAVEYKTSKDLKSADDETKNFLKTLEQTNIDLKTNELSKPSLESENTILISNNMSKYTHNSSEFVISRQSGPTEILSESESWPAASNNTQQPKTNLLVSNDEAVEYEAQKKSESPENSAENLIQFGNKAKTESLNIFKVLQSTNVQVNSLSLDNKVATSFESYQPPNVGRTFNDNLADESAGIGKALPVFLTDISRRSTIIIIFSSVTAFLFTVISLIIFVISFQRQHGTLDIEMQERNCGKDDLDELDAQTFTKLLEVQLPLSVVLALDESEECL